MCEIEHLHGIPFTLRDQALPPGENPLARLSGGLFDLSLQVTPGDATAFELILKGATVRYSVAEETLTCLGRTAPLSLQDRRLRLRVLLDRTSIEVFGNDGELSLTSCFLPNDENPPLSLRADGGTAEILSLEAFPLCSSWR